MDGQRLYKCLLLSQLLSALGCLLQRCAKSTGPHRRPGDGEKEVGELSTELRPSFTFYFIWCVRVRACMCVAHVCADDA